jgi:hypothetical protein
MCVVKLKWLRKNQLWPISSFYLVVFLEILRKSTKNISQDNRCTHRDLNRVLPEQKSA